jgi:hypothetical protein
LTCGIFASLRPRNVYKYMLNNLVSLIDHVGMNHQSCSLHHSSWRIEFILVLPLSPLFVMLQIKRSCLKRLIVVSGFGGGGKMFCRPPFSPTSVRRRRWHWQASSWTPPLLSPRFVHHAPLPMYNACMHALCSWIVRGSDRSPLTYITLWWDSFYHLSESSKEIAVAGQWALLHRNTPSAR